LIIIENDKLIQACCRNDVDAVKCLLDNNEINAIDLKKGINRSALHEAVLHRDGRALVRLLCQCGADPKQRDSLG
jgi:ankyrin repeat protein